MIEMAECLNFKQGFIHLKQQALSLLIHTPPTGLLPKSVGKSLDAQNQRFDQPRCAIPENLHANTQQNKSR